MLPDPRTPLNCPRQGCRSFEVEVHNLVVREMLKQNRDHPDYGERWADGMRQVVAAHDEEEACRIVSRRYPPDKGFVISAVAAV